jgi:hypothetical protein
MVGGTHGGMGAAGSAGYNRKAGFAYLQAGHMILRGVIAIAMSCVWGMQAGAQQTDVPRKLLEPIIVTAKKQHRQENGRCEKGR